MRPVYVDLYRHVSFFSNVVLFFFELAAHCHPIHASTTDCSGRVAKLHLQLDIDAISASDNLNTSAT
jgi:hypothetical protein